MKRRAWFLLSVHEPIMANNIILILEQDWRSIQETLYLVSVPGMRESIIEGGEVHASACSSKLVW
jgi:antitoxin YefM